MPIPLGKSTGQIMNHTGTLAPSIADPYEIAEAEYTAWTDCYTTNWETPECLGIKCKRYDDCLNIAAEAEAD